MEGLIFWLVPVALLIVFILLVLRHQHDYAKAPLTLVEPLNFTIKRWRVARFIGGESQLKAMLTTAKQANCSTQSNLEILLQSLPLESARPSGELLRCQPLPLLGEQKIIASGERILSLLIGDVTEVLPAVKYSENGKSLLTAELRSEHERVAATASQHGYLPLAIAFRYVHGMALIEPKHHTYLGLVLLEPILDDGSLKRLRTLRQDRVKFLSVLPAGLLGWLRAKVWQTEEFTGITSSNTDHPQEKEAFWTQSPVIGSATLRERYGAVRFFQHSWDCRVISGNAEDEQLPVRPTKLH